MFYFKKKLRDIKTTNFSKEFEIQHNSQCRGSIMENIMDKALINIFIKEDIEYKKYDNLIQALTVIQNEL